VTTTPARLRAAIERAPPRSEWVAVRGGWEAAGLLDPR
jgi:hypothetical protein